MTPRYLTIALALVAGLAVTPAWAQNDATLVQFDAVKREPLNQTFSVIGRLVGRHTCGVEERVAGAVAGISV